MGERHGMKPPLLELRMFLEVGPVQIRTTLHLARRRGYGNPMLLLEKDADANCRNKIGASDDERNLFVLMRNTVMFL